MFFEDVDRAPALIEILVCQSEGLFFCRDQVTLLFTDFEKVDLQPVAGGFSGQIRRDELWLRGLEPLGPADTRERKGSALLPEEERVLCLWQSSGEFIVSSEDQEWNRILGEALQPEEIIWRPGSSTFLWRLPPGSLALG